PVALSITILHPAPGAVLPRTAFLVCGTYEFAFRKKDCIDRNSRLLIVPNISVSLTRGASTVPAASVNYGTDTWSAAFQNVTPAIGYNVTASITDGTDTVSNVVEGVDVVSNQRIMYVAPCVEKDNPIETMLALDAKSKTVPLTGKHDGSGQGILGVV